MSETKENCEAGGRCAPPICSAFDEWWNMVGQFYDPDTSDVPWEDKRRLLAELAFDAAITQGRARNKVVEALNAGLAVAEHCNLNCTYHKRVINEALALLTQNE